MVRNMNEFEFEYITDFQFKKPVSEHYYSLKFVPHTNTRQKIRIDELSITPGTNCRSTLDSFGNRKHYGSISNPHTSFHFHVKGHASINLTTYEDDAQMLAMFRSFTPLTTAGKGIRQWIDEVKQTSEYQKLLTRERSVFWMHKLHEKLVYEQNVTTVNTTAEEAFSLGKGVCQDYSHILLAILRTEHIPARYVVGLMEGEGYSHAWVEAYHDQKWYSLDPTNDVLANNGYIKISHGRDYQDCIVCKGYFSGYGKVEQEQNIRVVVSPAFPG